MNVFGKGRLYPALIILIFLSLASVFASCTSGEGSDASPGESTGASAPELPAPSPTPEVSSQVSHPVSRVSPSLEEQIFASEFIIRASLVSAAASTETVPSNPGIAPTYRALQLLRFTAHEYLKGTGPSEVMVIVRGRHTYTSESEARVFADLKLMQRNTAWDDRQGALFLNRTRPPGQAGSAEGQNETAFEFTLSNFGVETEWDYSIDTLSRAWLPATEAGQPDGDFPELSTLQFTTNGSASTAVVISLEELRTGIAEMEATLEAGAGIQGFARCIQEKIRYERYRRAVPYSPYQHSIDLTSGLPAGTEIYRNGPFHDDRIRSRDRLTGTNKRLFQTSVEDVDSNPRNGYDRVISTLRPLPAGRYEYEYRVEQDVDAPCEFVPEPYLVGTITVIAPRGTLHEAFFDPVASGDAVGFTAEAGVLEPAAFSVNGPQTSIQVLKWESGVVTLEFSPGVPLAGGRIDFISIDGSVSLSLSFDDAQPQGDGSTLTWSVPHEPWADGDRLMIRIRDVVR